MKHPRATISLAALVSAVVWAATAAPGPDGAGRRGAGRRAGEAAPDG